MPDLRNLRITANSIEAEVQGTRTMPYTVRVEIDPPLGEDEKGWASRSVKDSEGELGDAEPPSALIPCRFFCSCTCPDLEEYCKHAAMLYAVGAAMTTDPRVLLKLNDIDTDVKTRSSSEDILEELLEYANTMTARTLDREVAGRIFGIVDYERKAKEPEFPNLRHIFGRGTLRRAMELIGNGKVSEAMDAATAFTRSS